jgi:hypothetical protein
MVQVVRVQADDWEANGVRREPAMSEPVRGETCVSVPFRDGRGGRAFVSLGGQTVRLDGRYFEWSDRFGPLFVTKTGRARKAPHQHDPWWKSLELWIVCGKRVTEGGDCVIDMPSAASDGSPR